MTLDLSTDEADALRAILEHAGQDLRQQARGASQQRAYWVKLADTAQSIANRLQAPARPFVDDTPCPTCGQNRCCQRWPDCHCNSAYDV